MWHQLDIKVHNSEPTNQKHKDELRRGMPESPLITYFRLNVVEIETLQTISSSIFRCVIVEERTRNGITHRPWRGADGIVSPLSAAAFRLVWLTFFGTELPSCFATDSLRRLLQRRR